MPNNRAIRNTTIVTSKFLEVNIEQYNYCEIGQHLPVNKCLVV